MSQLYNLECTPGQEDKALFQKVTGHATSRSFNAPRHHVLHLAVSSEGLVRLGAVRDQGHQSPNALRSTAVPPLAIALSYISLHSFLLHALLLFCPLRNRLSDSLLYDHTLLQLLLLSFRQYQALHHLHAEPPLVHPSSTVRCP